MKILPKLLILLFVLTIIPIVALGYMAIGDIKNMQATAISNINLMGKTAAEDSVRALNTLGETFIKQVTEDVGKQIEIYVKNNPGMTLTDLQADEDFNAIAVQPIGRLGYTVLMDHVGTVVIHPNPQLVGATIEQTEARFPDIAILLKEGVANGKASGYYKYAASPEEEPKDKFQVNLLTNPNIKTADGYSFMISFGVFIDEFSKPAKETESKIKTSAMAVVTNIASTAGGVMNKTMILILLIVLIVLVAGIIFAQSLVKPIKKLTVAGNKIGEGDLSVELPKITTKDEIKELSDTMNLLVGALKYKKNK
ncbi:HAMP domain-containing protein [Patescibacteria group bacterium]